jgi:hypothetical protein
VLALLLVNSLCLGPDRSIANHVVRSTLYGVRFTVHSASDLRAVESKPVNY